MSSPSGNSIEQFDILVKLATPVIAGIFLWRVSLFVESAKEQASRNSQITAKRIELVEMLISDITLLYQFGRRSEYWCERTPLQIQGTIVSIQHWEILGRLYFGANTLVILRQFLDVCADCNGHIPLLKGNVVKVQEIYENGSRIWNKEWDLLFNEGVEVNLADLEQKWNLLLKSLRNDLNGL